MSKGTINRVILIGNLGADPEIRTSPNGTVIANLRLATSERRKEGEQWVDHTEWHRVTVFGRTAETARDYLRKGGKVLIEGSLRTRKWQDKNGQDQYSYEIFVQDMQMMDRPSGGSSGASVPAAGRDRPPQHTASAQGAWPQHGAPRAQGQQSGDYDDEIPF